MENQNKKQQNATLLFLFCRRFSQRLSSTFLCESVPKREIHSFYFLGGFYFSLYYSLAFRNYSQYTPQPRTPTNYYSVLFRRQWGVGCTCHTPVADWKLHQRKADQKDGSLHSYRSEQWGNVQDFLVGLLNFQS